MQAAKKKPIINGRSGESDGEGSRNHAELRAESLTHPPDQDRTGQEITRRHAPKFHAQRAAFFSFLSSSWSPY